jgi:hypothetical protein
MIKSFRVLAAVGCVFLALEADAILTTVNPLGEFSSSQPLGLQGIIDARGNTLVTIGSDADQLDNGLDTAWTSIGGSSAAMVIEVAGYAPNNAFGIYNLADPGQRSQIFAGAASGGASVSFLSPYITFGFYLQNTSAGFVWYSDSSLNKDGQLDHMVAYQGKGQTLNLGINPNNPVGSALWDSNSYLLGWEDLNLGDYDYNDMVVVVRNVSPFPDIRSTPGVTVPDAYSTVTLLGAAIVGLIIFQRLRAKEVRLGF